MRDGHPTAGHWDQVDPTGIVRLRFEAPLAAGPVVLRFTWDAPYVAGTKGIYVAHQAGRAYVATQLATLEARRVFPCFDQPGSKVPFELALIVPDGDQAIANTREIGRDALPGGVHRVRFAPTPPLPSYLVAFAVGPYDIVAAPDVPPSRVRPSPLPLRAVAAHGRGGEMALALARGGDVVRTLEDYFGVAYPFDKLDLIAIPERTDAMENAGAIMFAEDIILVDPVRSSDRQLREFGRLITHETSHQWVGDLVTLRWWNEVWLNEAFATWVAGKLAERWDPKIRSALILLGRIQDAMAADALPTAHPVRSAIASNDDIQAAFDVITCQKGAALLRMFESWVGEAAFQRGVRRYLSARAFGNATADDFLAAVAAESGKDIAPAFHSFLDQPGTPLVEVTRRALVHRGCTWRSRGSRRRARRSMHMRPGRSRSARGGLRPAARRARPAR